MQLYALDQYNQLVFAKSAKRQIDYTCPECRSIVHLRGGVHRQKHFYHLEADRECRQNGKSSEHLNIQLYFLQILPDGECFLEQQFPLIHRIADVVWTTKKIVFEIQCSPISAEEVAGRNRDYAKEGYEVVWILHDNRYNQKRLSGAEFYLQTRPHYFSNISETGEGIIYDQFCRIQKGERIQRLKPLPIDVSEPQIRKVELRHRFLTLVKKRQQKSLLHFAGDLVDLSNYLNNKDLEEAIHAEWDPIKGKENQESVAKNFKAWVLKAYHLFFQLLLERACK